MRSGFLSPHGTMRLRGGDDSDGSGSMEEDDDDDGNGVEIDLKEVKVDRPDYVLERHEFNHVIRVLNTNIDGTRTVRVSQAVD